MLQKSRHKTKNITKVQLCPFKKTRQWAYYNIARLQSPRWFKITFNQKKNLKIYFGKQWKETLFVVNVVNKPHEKSL